MKIRRRKYRSGRTGWQLDCGMINGRRVQLAYGTKDEAEAERTRRMGKVKQSGHDSLSMTEEERIRCQSVMDKLAGVGASIEQACDFYLLHHQGLQEPVTWEAMCQECRDDKWNDGASDRYRKALKSVGHRFGLAGHALRMVDQISSEDIEGWLRVNYPHWKTYNNYLGDLHSIFGWGVDKKYLSINPCAGVKKRKPRVEDLEEVKFLELDACRKLLERAADPRPGLPLGKLTAEKREMEDFRDCLAYVVLGLFCGLRPEREIGKKDWTHVKIENRLVVVTAGRAKGRERRTVTLSENAVEWLKLCPVTTGPILPKNFDQKWIRLREACGLYETWPHDAMRHTFASYHYAHHEDEAKLQVQMGHQDAKMLHQHYRGLATPAQGKAFWELSPSPALLSRLAAAE